MYKLQDPYSKPTEVFSNLLENHVLMKTKTVRGNQVPFMTIKVSKKNNGKILNSK